MRTEKNDRNRRALHDQAERLHPIHAGHFEVESDDVGAQFFNFLQRECAIHGRSDHFDGRISGKNRGNQFPHQSGIVNDENADAFAHAIAPRGVARERRERTAGTFKIRTTVPSPRIEAPLTRSLDTISPGKALITNSSSPTRVSTTRPKRFSAAPMTMTKFFFFFDAESTA